MNKEELIKKMYADRKEKIVTIEEIKSAMNGEAILEIISYRDTAVQAYEKLHKIMTGKKKYRWFGCDKEGMIKIMEYLSSRINEGDEGKKLVRVAGCNEMMLSYCKVYLNYYRIFCWN